VVPNPDDFSRINLYTVLHGLPEGVTLANAEGRIVFSNEAADRILGTTAATEAVPDEWASHYGVFLPDGSTPFPTDQYPLVRPAAPDDVPGPAPQRRLDRERWLGISPRRAGSDLCPRAVRQPRDHGIMRPYPTPSAARRGRRERRR